MIDGSVLQSAQRCFEKKSRVVVKMVVKDFKKATFLPGSIKKFFTLERYQPAALARKFFADSQFHR